ncbi:MAG: glycosyltransferase [Bacteroidia bacterium]|nr:glycosyltransferase [Bacteroidia bacterium]
MILFYFFLIVFGLSILIQLIFWCLVSRRLLFYRQEEAGFSPVSEYVSVVVCAHNEYMNLRELVPRLLDQVYPNYELIIVDDRSEDDSPHWLADLSRQQPRLRWLRIDKTPADFHPKKFALTQGINTAKGDIILLTDADCRPASSDWIRHMQAQLSPNRDMVLGFSPYISQKSLLNAFIRYETLYTAIQYLSLTLAGMPYMGVGRNLMYRKEIFQQSEGFANHRHILGGDDDLFVGRIARRGRVGLCVNREAYVFSYPKSSWGAWFRQKIRHLSVGKYYRPEVQWVLGSLHFSLIGFWLSFLILLTFTMSDTFWALIIAGFLLRLITILAFFAAIDRKLHGQVPIISIALFDFLYVFYIFIIGTLAISIKKIRWE